jgi:hypothetical protein
MMAFNFSTGGYLHAPFFIFIRCVGAYSDAELLRRFGLAGYKRVPVPPDSGPHVCLTEDSQWTHIADDWCYTLWHDPCTRDTIAEMAKEHDVFAGSVGDCDHSWEFVYYRQGRLLRKHVVEDPHFRGGIVVEEIGIPLEGEAGAMKRSHELESLLAIATSLGIDVLHSTKEIRVYSPRVR